MRTEQLGGWVNEYCSHAKFEGLVDGLGLWCGCTLLHGEVAVLGLGERKSLVELDVV